MRDWRQVPVYEKTTQWVCRPGGVVLCCDRVRFFFSAQVQTRSQEVADKTWKGRILHHAGPEVTKVKQRPSFGRHLWPEGLAKSLTRPLERLFNTTVMVTPFQFPYQPRLLGAQREDNAGIPEFNVQNEAVLRAAETWVSTKQHNRSHTVFSSQINYKLHGSWSFGERCYTGQKVSREANVAV